MSVTQNYKTITVSDATYDEMARALRYAIVKAGDRIVYWQECSANEPMLTWSKEDMAGLMAAQKELLESAKNAATVLTREDTHGALKGEILDTVLLALRNQRGAAIQNLEMMRRMFSEYQAGKLGAPWVHQGDVDRKKVAINDIDAALLFLENPK